MPTFRNTLSYKFYVEQTKNTTNYTLTCTTFTDCLSVIAVCKSQYFQTWYKKFILIYVQQDVTLHSLFYLETALHVSGGTITHHQESKLLYLQHLVFVIPLLLSAAIVEELEPVWVCCGWAHKLFLSTYSCSKSNKNVDRNNKYAAIACDFVWIVCRENASTWFVASFLRRKMLAPRNKETFSAMFSKNFTHRSYWDLSGCALWLCWCSCCGSVPASAFSHSQKSGSTRSSPCPRTPSFSSISR